MAVTAGIAGANLISQGEVSLVVWRGGVGWGGGSSPCTTVNTRYILIRCHRGVWSARENLSRIPGREWAEGGEQRKRAVTREQGGGADGSGGGWRRVCPLAVSVAYLSLSLSHSPERLSPPLVFLPFSPWLPAVHTFAVSSRRSTSGTSTLRKISTAAVTPVLHNRQRSFQKEKNKQSRKILLFTSPSKKKKKPPTHVQRYKLRSFCFYQAPFWVVRSSWKSLENSSQTWCSPPAQRLQAAPRQRRNTRAIRHCLPFSSGDIEYISRLNLIRNTAEWQGPIVFATTMVTEITG